MGKNQQLELPTPPTQYVNPLQRDDIAYQSGIGHDLTSGNLNGNLSWLQPLLNNNNGANALSAAQGTLQPQFRDTLQQINNQAAANGQLNSSTYTDALARSQSDLNSQYQSIVSQQAINDSNQNNQNRLNLFGSGLNTLQQGIGNEQQDSGATNQFNLQNYDNLVAQTIQQNQNANNATGFQQAIGLLSPIGNDYLKSQGINQVPGYGVGQTAQIAGTIMGFANGFGGFGGQGGLGQSTNALGNAGTAPGQFASNNPWSGIGLNPTTGAYSYLGH